LRTEAVHLAKLKKHAKDDLEDDVVWSTRNLIWAAVIIAVFTGIAFLVHRTKSSQPREYEGRVIDKGARYRNSEIGSRPVFHLLVETRSGQRISVMVDRDLYYRVKVGTWIKKTDTGVELSAKQGEGHPEKHDPLITLIHTKISFVTFSVFRG
jgi:hypothetical protein